MKSSGLDISVITEENVENMDLFDRPFLVVEDDSYFLKRWRCRKFAPGLSRGFGDKN